MYQCYNPAVIAEVVEAEEADVNVSVEMSSETGINCTIDALSQVFNKFRSGYNKCIKKLFGYHRTDSMSGIPMNLCLPTAGTIVHNSRVLFHQPCNASCNKIVQWFADIGVF